MRPRIIQSPGLGEGAVPVTHVASARTVPKAQSSHRTEPSFDCEDVDHDGSLVHGHSWVMSSTVR